MRKLIILPTIFSFFIFYNIILYIILTFFKIFKYIAHSKNISASLNGSNTQASIVKSSVDDVSSTVDSITDGPNLKKRNLPTDDTSGSESIASRVKVLRRTTNENQNQSRPPDTALASPGSNQDQ